MQYEFWDLNLNLTNNFISTHIKISLTVKGLAQNNLKGFLKILQ